MRYCYQCHHFTIGQALYCNRCGMSYDVKVCPARHLNPRNAEVCSECGSRDLSTPAPRMPLWLAPVLFLLALVPGGGLVLVLLVLSFNLAHTFLTTQQIPLGLLLRILAVSLVWFAYIHLPHFITDLFRSSWRRGRHRHIR